jgi:hypothetical protein
MDTLNMLQMLQERKRQLCDLRAELQELEYNRCPGDLYTAGHEELNNGKHEVWTYYVVVLKHIIE